ncbi:nucleoside triphosphate pyrophosphohydrolase [Dichotomicrobium thermohalophilum]|uniref:ATP diphosphatase n=1 Tax=Dichotomicrobium thermohalophilum TaxID=933063 RepID=A0A397Q614_9HYPH|nr:nucleoside triphosphate pyrophosphohydrolase [Dichotomicrobium thermohalophilum]RIA56488.1 ATP diphosphatase [Dichotomicrobium thermohalophilum]
MARGKDDSDKPGDPSDLVAAAETPIQRLRAVMAALRDPEAGCPWDREQSFATIAPYTIEEAYEVAEAIAREDMAELREELGDLLFQVVYHAQLAEERGAFDFDDVAGTVADKMIRRHPHVFGEYRAESAAEVGGLWEEMKRRERAEKGRAAPESVLDEIPLALPGLTRAWKLHRKAARAGFDWSSPQQVFAKIREELDELEAEIVAGEPAERVADELGDVLFTVTRLAGFVDQDPEAIMRAAQRKFTRRFKYMEARLREAGRAMSDASMDELEDLWHAAKRAEKVEG